MRKQEHQTESVDSTSVVEFGLVVSFITSVLKCNMSKASWNSGGSGSR